MGRGGSVVSPKAQMDVHSVPGAVGIRDRRKAGATAATAGSLANELARDRGVVAGSERVSRNGRELELVSAELRQERLERAAGHPERRRHLPRKGLGGAERVEREEGARLVPLEEELVLECDKQGQAGLGAERLESALQERSRARAPVASVNLDGIGQEEVEWADVGPEIDVRFRRGIRDEADVAHRPERVVVAEHTERREGLVCGHPADPAREPLLQVGGRHGATSAHPREVAVEKGDQLVSAHSQDCILSLSRPRRSSCPVAEGPALRVAGGHVRRVAKQGLDGLVRTDDIPTGFVRPSLVS